MKIIFLSIFRIFLCLTVFLVLYKSADAYPERIVSLTPSTTELLFAFGLKNKLVGVTTACLFPEEAKQKYKIGSMVAPSVEVIVALKPDIVVGSSDSVSTRLIERLNSIGLKTYVMPSDSLTVFPNALREFGAVLGAKRQADIMARRLERELAEIKRKFVGRQKKSVLYIVWPDPPIAAGASTPINDALETFGFSNAGLCGQGYYPSCSFEEIIKRDPDIIIIGTAHANAMEKNDKFLDNLKFLRAVKTGRVYYMSDNLYRLGPRFIDGLRELKEILLK